MRRSVLVYWLLRWRNSLRVLQLSSLYTPPPPPPPPTPPIPDWMRVGGGGGCCSVLRMQLGAGGGQDIRPWRTLVQVTFLVSVAHEFHPQESR